MKGDGQMKTITKGFWAAIVGAAVLLSSAIPSMAEPAVPVPLTAATPERVFCAINELIDDGSLLKEKYTAYPVKDENGEGVIYGYLVDGDGFFSISDTDEIFAGLLFYILSGYGCFPEGATVEEHYGIYNIYDVLDAVCENSYNLFAMSEEFKGKYPTHEDYFNRFIIGEIFGGDADPDPIDVYKFIMDGKVYRSNSAQTYIPVFYYLTYKSYDSDDRTYFTGAEVLSPDGDYLKVLGIFDGHRNVYDHVDALWEGGKLTAYEMFEILTGYAADHDGYLFTPAPLAEITYTDRRGIPLTDAKQLLGDDLTVSDTGLSAREYVIGLMADDKPQEILTQLYGSLPHEMAVAFAEYYIDDTVIAAECEAELDLYIDGLTATDDRERAGAILEYVLDYDPRGNLVKYGGGYLYDRENKRVNINDIMNGSGRFLIDGYGAVNVQSLFKVWMNHGVDPDGDFAPGDANGDGKVNITDAVALLKYIAEWDVGINLASADVDADGFVGMKDVQFILKHVAGWDVVLKK